MRQCLGFFLVVFLSITSCSEDNDDNLKPQALTTFTFSHNWDEAPVTNINFNALNYSNANGEVLSIERLRYVISDITFTTSNNEIIVLDNYNLVDVTNNNNLSFSPQTLIPTGTYSVSFTFGLDTEDNAENYLDLNSESFNVP